MMKISSHLKFLLIIPNISGFAISRLAERVGTSIFSNTPDIDSLLAIDNTAVADLNDWFNLASQYLDENGVCALVHNQLELYITTIDCQSRSRWQRWTISIYGGRK